MSAPRPPHLVLVGPTATGKSALALSVARAHRETFEVVSADSMQVYRGMDIGTAKPTPAERDDVPHHLIDMCDPTEDYSVARFQRDVTAALDGIESRARRAIVVGGTGLYVHAVVDGLAIPGQWPDVRDELEAEADTAALHRRLVALDADAAARMEPTNRRRIVRALEVTIGSGRPFSSFGPGINAFPPTDRFAIVGITAPRPAIGARIEQRFAAMLDAGLLREVEALARTYDGRLSRTARQALGYRELLRHVEGAHPLDECVADAIARTKRFATRQERWFRRDPRIVWIDAPVNDLTFLERLNIT